MVVIGHRVADQDEDNAGHEGLANLQQPWSCRHVTCHLSWPGFSQAHFPHVGDRCQAGEDCGGNAIAAGVIIYPLVFEEKKGKDDGGRKAEKSSIAGHSYGEIGPGHWGSGLEAKLLHQQDQQGADEAEHPAEDAPVTKATIWNGGSMCCEAERDAGEQQSSYAYPKQLGSGTRDHWHDCEITISPEMRVASLVQRGLRYWMNDAELAAWHTLLRQ